MICGHGGKTLGDVWRGVGFVDRSGVGPPALDVVFALWRGNEDNLGIVSASVSVNVRGLLASPLTSDPATNKQTKKISNPKPYYETAAKITAANVK